MAWSLHVCVCTMGKPVGAQAPAYPSGKPHAQMAVTVLCQWCCVRCYMRNKSRVWRQNTLVLALHQALALTSAPNDFSLLISIYSDVPSAPGTKEIIKAWSSFPRMARQAPAHVRFFRPGRVESQESQAPWSLGPGRGLGAPNQSTVAPDCCLLKCPSVQLPSSLCKQSLPVFQCWQEIPILLKPVWGKQQMGGP